MKKKAKTEKKPSREKALNESLQQTKDKAQKITSEQTEKKAPIKSPQAEDKSLISSSKQIKKENPFKVSQSTEKKSQLNSLPKADTRGIKKQYLKSKPACEVTFRLPKDAAPGARRVSIVGDFNNWDVSQCQMKKMDNGDFSLTMELTCNREYSFRYLIDAEKWENDWFADKYIPNEYGEDNSVVVV